MIKLEKLTFNPFQENTYLLYDETGECVVIDPGCLSQAERIHMKSTIEKMGLKPVKLIFTHLHLDHVFGSKFVADQWHLPVLAHADDEFFIGLAQASSARFGIQFDETPAPLTGHLKEGDTVGFGNSEVDVIHVPGHSPGGICFYAKDEKILVAGDVLFYSSVGRTDLAGGSHEQLIENIKGKLLALPDDVQVFPGHGPSTTIGQERWQNPFLS
ncbi:MAG: MBL fold metallo-hydrolase [Breznakibacter sp.]